MKWCFKSFAIFYLSPFEVQGSMLWRHLQSVRKISHKAKLKRIGALWIYNARLCGFIKDRRRFHALASLYLSSPRAWCNRPVRQKTKVSTFDPRGSNFFPMPCSFNTFWFPLGDYIFIWRCFIRLDKADALWTMMLLLPFKLMIGISLRPPELMIRHVF